MCFWLDHRETINSTATVEPRLSSAGGVCSAPALPKQGGTVILVASNDRDNSDENRQTYSH